MKFKKLLCKIFGHRLGKERHETVEYVRMNNMGCYGTSPKRRKKKKVVRTFLKCRRCGAMIMVGKRKVY